MINEKLNAYIIESGSNENGNYVKYADGTLIQYITLPKTFFLQESETYSTIQNIKFYRSPSNYFNLPTAFINTNYVATVTSLSRYFSGVTALRVFDPIVVGKEINRLSIQLTSLRPFTETSDTYKELVQVDVMAIGRWK